MNIFLTYSHLNLKCEIFLQIFDDHYKEWKLDTKCFLGVCWAGYICCAGTERAEHQENVNLKVLLFNVV